MKRTVLVSILFLGNVAFCSKNLSVIIIGAGPAGIAAATKLLENNIDNLKILEAENRIGGRVHSVKFGDAFVDVGAEFCHGQDGNIVYELVKEFNILQHSPKNHSFTIYYSNGEQLDEDVTEDINSFIQHNEGAVAKKYNHKLPDVTTTSIGDYILDVYKNTVLKDVNNSSSRYNVLQDAIPSIEREINAELASFSWLDVYIKPHYEQSEGDQSMTWGGYGYKTVLEILMKSFPDPSQKLPIDDKFHLNKTVTKVKWDGPEGVVECSDGTSYNADHIIFTPSIGVLKDQHEKLFFPRLPENKVDAIKGVGFGGVIKLIMHFPKKWWPDFTQLLFVWKKEDLENSGKDFPLGVIQNGVSWITKINGAYLPDNNTNVIICWVTGDWVPEIEKIPVEILKQGAFHALKKFLGKKYKVEEPDDLLYSSWVNNPNFRGTWTYETVESHKKKQYNQKVLMEPLSNTNGTPILLFAGESTNPTHFSTVHGAIETGHREAERIMKLHS